MRATHPDGAPVMGRRSEPQSGQVYVIHLATRLHHAGHYVGFATDLAGRIARHRTGSGARLMEVIRDAGIAWKLVKVMPGDRSLERRLKNGKNTPRRLCPVCRGEVAYDAVDERDVLPLGVFTEGDRPVGQPVPQADGGGDDPPF